MASLEFAYMCLRNAYQILTNPESEAVDVNSRLYGCVAPSNAISEPEFNKLKCSVLTSLAYVSLSLNDYLNTIKYCSILLSECEAYLPKGSR